MRLLTACCWPRLLPRDPLIAGYKERQAAQEAKSAAGWTDYGYRDGSYGKAEKPLLAPQAQSPPLQVGLASGYVRGGVNVPESGS